MSIETLQERTLCESGLRVDRAAGVIRGVKIIGSQSRNNRTYPPAVLQKAIPHYEGRGCFLDHTAGQRSVASRFGWLQNVRGDGASLIGDLNILKSHPNAPAIFEAAERNPRLFGLSHSADGRVVRRGGKNVVEEIVGVHSVDLVCDPATTNSLFESAAPTASLTGDAGIIEQVKAVLLADDLDDATKLEAIAKAVGGGVKLGGGAAVAESVVNHPKWQLPSALQSREEKEQRRLDREKLCRRLVGTRTFIQRQKENKR